MGMPGAAGIVDGVAGNDSLAAMAADIITNQDVTAVQGIAEALEKLKHTGTRTYHDAGGSIPPAHRGL